MNTETVEVETLEVETPTVVVPTKSKGQLFKERTGFSKTMKRNMKKHNCSTPEEYRKVRMARKKAGLLQTPKRKKEDTAKAKKK